MFWFLLFLCFCSSFDIQSIPNCCNASTTYLCANHHYIHCIIAIPNALSTPSSSHIDQNNSHLLPLSTAFSIASYATSSLHLRLHSLYGFEIHFTLCNIQRIRCCA
eukprot:333907_1